MVATRNLRAAHPKRKSFDRNTVLAAMDAIQTRNADAMASAGLLVDEWGDKRIENIERTMFQGAFCKAPKKPAPADGGFGQSIPTPEETAGSLPSPASSQTPTSKRPSGVSFEE